MRFGFKSFVSTISPRGRCVEFIELLVDLINIRNQELSQRQVCGLVYFIYILIVLLLSQSPTKVSYETSLVPSEHSFGPSDLRDLVFNSGTSLDIKIDLIY